MRGLPLKKLRNFGGKLGDQLASLGCTTAGEVGLLAFGGCGDASITRWQVWSACSSAQLAKGGSPVEALLLVMVKMHDLASPMHMMQAHMLGRARLQVAALPYAKLEGAFGRERALSILEAVAGRSTEAVTVSRSQVICRYQPTCPNMRSSQIICLLQRLRA